jgi:fructose-specific phosphotransferase system IIA component
MGITEYSKLLDPACIDLNLKGKKKKEVVEELIDLLVRSGKLQNGKDIAEEVLEREKITSTAIGKGVAIPHKLIRGISQTLIAFGRKNEGVNFDAIDKAPVSLFFLLLGPEGHTGEHLKLLSKLARYLHDDGFIRALKEAKNPEDIIQVFRLEEDI